MSKLEKVMLVEDDPDIQLIARMSLEILGGYQVELCENGLVALEKLPVYRPQLVLLDVMMPKMDGPTVLSHIRKMPDFKTLPVVFMTAKAQAHEVDDYYAQGVQGLIIKPFEPDELAHTLEVIWQRHQE